jgi:endonuclease I
MAAMLAVTVAATAARAGIIVSELCDPLNNYPTDRFIEIYNTGPDAVDLTGWSVVAVANGADGTTWALSGTLPAGQARVCGYTTPVAVFTVNFPNAAWNALTSGGGAYNWNGKVGDGVKLKDNTGTVVDIVVATGTLFTDSDMVRNASVTSPNSTYTASEWTITAVTLATNASPGSHNGSVVTGGGPVISDVATLPLSPVAGDPVSVYASVVDTSGAIASVTLSWGTASGSLPNSVAMSLLSDSTYTTTSQIPGQASGATVYYRIQAVGAVATTLSSLFSYTIPGGTAGAPTVLAVGEMSDSTLLVQFSEPVDPVTSQVPGNYTVGALTAVAAAQDPVVTANVLITVRGLTAGTQTVTVNGVADLSSNIAYGATRSFTYIDVSIPAGYYASAIGLKGWALRYALHNIIKGHTVGSYAGALTSFGTTDIRPDGHIWDMYSDIPGGTPPYLYDFGQTGSGATEGLGYNREHSWPQSWFNGVSPPYSDLWVLYPTDAYVNNRRSNYAFGEVGTASWTSLNGSKVGTSASAGFSGTVFEPIDAYKGDFSRGLFYVSNRYLGEDSGWSTSDATNHAELLPWAAAQYLLWANADPVSWKERLRNGAVYSIQHNRNPFIDHPEFVVAIYDSNAVAGVEPARPVAGLRLAPSLPNPFSNRTTLAFDLPAAGPVSLVVFDVSGRRVRTLVDGRELSAGRHGAEWDGRDDAGSRVQAGLYFAQLRSRDQQDMRRLVFTH